ncbi:MAG TPA: adenylate/guanylate cyclase domain-containing protein [Chloroflexota bacterium]|nr:adenylate/guanylate cyclase domain-containing protein [Chloroflexota bacterium]
MDHAPKILVVDDTPANIKVLDAVLSPRGYEVLAAANGEEGLAKVASEQPDLVLLDVLMPGIDGHEVCRRLRADPATQLLPVVMMTASGEQEKIKAIEAGADDFVLKPFNQAELVARVKSLLRIKDYHDSLELERQRSADLLRVILPHEIIEELETTKGVQPRRYEDVAVLFCDIAGFTGYCDGREPQEIISKLQELVEAYEELMVIHELRKIKTIGDCFMATCGLLHKVDNPVLNCVRCGSDMVEVVKQIQPEWEVRVGIHVGPVVAGVLGHRQYQFDLWGDTVNTASRMESNGPNGSVTLSRAALDQVAELCDCESLGMAPIKGKGELEMFRFVGFNEAGPPPSGGAAQLWGGA